MKTENQNKPKSRSRSRHRKKPQPRGPKINPLSCPETMTLEEWQCALRRQAAQKENLAITPPDSLLDYFIVSNPTTKSRYNVTYRGQGDQWNYCSCPDFRTNGLGTCKHIEAITLANDGKYARMRYPKPEYTAVYVDYRDNRRIKIRIGSYLPIKFRRLASELFDKNNNLLDEAYLKGDIDAFIDKARELDERFRWYDDAMEIIAEKRDRENRRRIMEERYAEGNLPGLVSADLYPYQADAVRFAFANGRTLIADDMGLGKTIEAIASAELLRKEGFASSALIVCPTSLKYQWQSEILRFTGQKAIIVEGNLLQRRELLDKDDEPFFKICSYHSLANNLKAGDHPETDILIFDEVQRLKNWNTQIARQMRRLTSDYVIALSGTPLENRLVELYSVMQLVDQFKLGPFYKFNHETTVTSDTGKVTGYKNLNNVAEQLSDVMLRRLKKDVALQMPPRTDTNMFVAMTPDQAEIHDENKTTVARLIARWSSRKFLTQSEQRRLLLALQTMRMVCDSTFILDQSTRHDTKIDIALDIVGDKLSWSEEKIVIFSQWERMLRIMATELEKRGIDFCFLHGGVPSAKRGELLKRFHDDPECRVFLSTDAGGTGLNLQSASLLINFDLPWNPAVLEQRIARIYRLKQKLPVQIINLIAQGTIEERMLDKLAFKSRMAAGILDGGEDSVTTENQTMTAIMDIFSEDEDKEKAVTVEIENEEPVSEKVPANNQGKKDSDGKSRTESPAEDPAENTMRVSLLKEEAGGNEPEPEKPVDEQPAPAEPEAPAAPTVTAEPKQEEEPALAKEQKATKTSDDEFRDMMTNGIEAIANFAGALSSPEGIQRMADVLVKTDSRTGESKITIPVKDKKTIVNLLTVIGNLLNK